MRTSAVRQSAEARRFHTKVILPDLALSPMLRQPALALQHVLGAEPVVPLSHEAQLAAMTAKSQVGFWKVVV